MDYTISTDHTQQYPSKKEALLDKAPSLEVESSSPGNPEDGVEPNKRQVKHSRPKLFQSSSYKRFIHLCREFSVSGLPLHQQIQAIETHGSKWTMKDFPPWKNAIHSIS